jgi:hypothetical protein
VYSPGHAALGDHVCIAPSHRHGYQNGQQKWYICLMLPPFAFDSSFIIAKRPCYGPFKLTPSFNVSLIGVY